MPACFVRSADRLALWPRNAAFADRSRVNDLPGSTHDACRVSADGFGRSVGAGVWGHLMKTSRKGLTAALAGAFMVAAFATPARASCADPMSSLTGRSSFGRNAIHLPAPALAFESGTPGRID